MTTTPASISADLQAAKPGAVLTLAPGNYGALGLSGKSGLTLKSDPTNPARFTSIALTKCSGMVLDGLTVSRPPQAGDSDNNVKALYLNSCDGVTIVNGDVEVQPATAGAYAGFGNGYPIYANLSKNLTIRGNHVRGGRRAIMMQYCDKALVEGNEAHHFRAVGVCGAGCNFLTIRGNYLHDANPWHWGKPGGDHGDFIHVWDGKGKPPIQGIIVEDNTLMQGSGWAILGITIQNTQKAGVVDARVANNLVITNHNQAILFSGVRAIDVQNNTLLATIAAFSTPTAIGGQARFQIGGAQSGIVSGNIWGAIASALPNCTVRNNLATKFADQARVFTNPTGSARADFFALAAGPGAGLGIH